MDNCIITISRQCGSGGHTIGKTVAEKMGIPFYDQHIMEVVSERSGLSMDTIQEKGEYSSSSLLYSIVTSGHYHGYDLSNKRSMPVPAQIFAYQTELIKELADKSSCVIVGRCADYILRNRPNCTHVYISGLLEDRKRRVVKEHHIHPDDAEEHVLTRDKKRAKHYELFTERTWGQAENYTLCLNSSALGVDGCVKLIIEVAERNQDKA